MCFVSVVDFYLKKNRTGNRPARKRNSREKRNYETAFSLGGKQKEALRSDE